MKNFKISYIWGFDVPPVTTYKTANTKEEAIKKLKNNIIFLRDDMILNIEEV